MSGTTEQKRAWRHAHPERVRAIEARYLTKRQQNPERAAAARAKRRVQAQKRRTKDPLKAAIERHAWRRKYPVSNAWANYRSSPAAQRTEFTLDRTLFEDLVTDNCFYCGAPPEPVNGIDRVDNARGYVEDNVVTACRQCNCAKNTHCRSDFERWVLRVAARLPEVTS